MAKELYNTPNLDELEKGPWPSFVTGLKRLAQDEHDGAAMVRDVLATLETSYVTKKGYWKGGTVGVVGYGGGIIPRFNELKDENGDYKFKDAGQFHTLRIQPPAGMHYTSQLLRDLSDMFVDNGGSGLIAFHGQSGDIMMQGADEEGVQKILMPLTITALTLTVLGLPLEQECPALERQDAKCQTLMSRLFYEH